MSLGSGRHRGPSPPESVEKKSVDLRSEVQESHGGAECGEMESEAGKTRMKEREIEITQQGPFPPESVRKIT